MDPTTTFCPNVACPARGQSGRGHIGLHARKDRRFRCPQGRKTFSATQGTIFDRLRTSAATVVLVVTWLASGCPGQAIVAAFGFDERPVADWWARSGRQGQAVPESLIEPPRDVGHVQADEIRVKKQGAIVWMALARMVKTRLGLGGEVSEQRALALSRRLIEQVKRWAARRPLLVCTAFRTPLITSMPLSSRGFGMEVEITALITKTRARLYEVPISYYGRTYEEDKKIKARDDFQALWYIFYYNAVVSRAGRRRQYIREANAFLVVLSAPAAGVSQTAVEDATCQEGRYST